MSNLFSNKNQFINYYKFYNIEDFEENYNVLDDPLKKIKNPNNCEVRQNLFIVNTNSIIHNKINNNENIEYDLVKKIPNTAGGNCFFKAISQFFTNKETYHMHYRQRVAILINSKQNEDKINYPYIYGNKNT